MPMPNTRTTYLSDGGSTRPSQYTPTSFSGVKQKYPVAQGPTSTNTVSDNRRPIGTSGYTAGSVTFDEGSKNTRPLTNRQRELVYKTYPVSTPKNEDTYVPPAGGTYGNVGYTAESVPATTGGGSGSATSKIDDTLNILKSLLEQQKKQADEYQKTLYEQALEKNKEEERIASENANRQYALTKRRLAEMYGNAVTGSGLSNNALNTVGWANAIGANQRDMANNNRSALASYNQGLANNASTLAQGWYNYVLPVYTNRQVNEDNLDFKKYLASLGLLG